MLQIRPSVRGTRRPFVSGTDFITRSLLKEERLQLAVAELGHRTKNLLTIVQAIASQTAQRSAGLKAFQCEFYQRLSALSRSMDLLVQQDGRGVGVAELVKTQLEPFGDIDGTRITVEGPDVHLNPEATQNLGMALHELATNATKYGALSVPHGAVSVHWELLPGNTDSARFRFVWREENGPATTPPSRRGFGSVVLERIAAAPLGGNVKHEFDVGGVSWTLDAAAAAVLMPDVEWNQRRIHLVDASSSASQMSAL